MKNQGCISWLIIVCTLIGLMHTHNAISQESLDFRLQPKPVGVVYEKINHYAGSEWLFANWHQGIVTFQNGQVIQGLPINYNAFSDQLVYKLNSNTQVAISQEKVARFSIGQGETHRTFISSQTDPWLNQYANADGYFELLVDGDIKLYACHRKKLNQSLIMDNPFNKSVYHSTTDYLLFVENQIITSPQKKRAYYNHFTKSEVKEILHKEQLTLSSEEDLVSFISKLNQLRLKEK